MPTSVLDRASHLVALQMLLGTYPSTRALVDGTLRSDLVEIAFANVAHPLLAFRRAVQDLEFDLAELPIVPFLMARARGRPLVLLPAVIIGRFQHPYLVYNAERGPLSPRDLSGKRIGLRAYSQTSAMWIRGVLQADFGLDPAAMEWVTLEPPYVDAYADPPNARRASGDKTLLRMLLDGDIDAAIVPDGGRADPRIRTLFREPMAESAAWHDRNEAIQINHMVVAHESLVARHPDAVREVFALLERSRRVAAEQGGKKEPPFGLEANRRNLEVAIDYCWRQRLIERPLSVDELFCDVTRALGA
ncbi:ABC transporter substrate-binding protein [Burkholderia perseverans]|uniref:ABC transporter substrate-binding protein n=1 Tax=Burkholderia perseverans TaxID=2615214 RepID=UPI001FEECB82|nr:ABC transporter substrate-binding protein [Burkholderia perseverans]